MTFSSLPRQKNMAEVATVSVLATAVAANRGLLSDNQKPTPPGKKRSAWLPKPHFHERVPTHGPVFSARTD